MRSWPSICGHHSSWLCGWYTWRWWAELSVWLAIVRETLVIVKVIHSHINQLNLLPPGGSNKFLRNNFFYITLPPTLFLAIFLDRYTYIFPWFNFWVQILYIQVPTKLFSGNLYYLFMISTFPLKWKNLQNGLTDIDEIWYTHGCTFKLVIFVKIYFEGNRYL